jgi:leucine-rich melanocyte differentiation-associated protein
MNGLISKKIYSFSDLLGLGVFRYFVLHKIPKLKFLDATPVSDAERVEAKRVGHLQQVARPDPEQYKKTSSTKIEFEALPADLRAPGEARASLGISRYVYQGRQSEGNRFIVDSDL